MDMLRLRLLPLAKKVIAGLMVLAVVFFIGRVYQSEKGPPLQRWHTWSADEMSASEIDKARFADYQAREEDIFREMKTDITDALSAEEKTSLNRFYAQSPVYPERFHPNWNRSFILMPEGRVRGAVVLLHGLTD